jgi:hypothetical protein
MDKNYSWNIPASAPFLPFIHIFFAIDRQGRRFLAPLGMTTEFKEQLGRSGYAKAKKGGFITICLSISLPSPNPRLRKEQIPHFVRVLHTNSIVFQVVG